MISKKPTKSRFNVKEELFISLILAITYFFNLIFHKKLYYKNINLFLNK